MKFTSDTQREWLLDISAQIVDTTLHYFLWAIEENEKINVSIQNRDGELEETKTLSDGLPGELYSEDGCPLLVSKANLNKPVTFLKKNSFQK
ncbi:hypothetical protein M3223_21730 [Paenibacillus pasadenensis]|uniref:hypothetical protein n=1 Tax=Paenibacillus pasadenensis TaxID=217090 RepID=UPI00203BE859|nr:hypothetical protein [Paenibacillus pasadenensis]MCM3749960.1 hypothetical protein [Paenibacillus pasadenensis]